MFSLIEPIISAVFWATVSSEPGHFSALSSSTVVALLFAIALATSVANARKFSLRPTKSVSQFTSTITPTLPSTSVSTAPSAVTRPAFLPAAASPFLRRIFVASSTLPSASVSAALVSIMPAPVASRSALTIAAVICVIDCSYAKNRRRTDAFAPVLRNQSFSRVRIRSLPAISDRLGGRHRFGCRCFSRRNHRFCGSRLALVFGTDVPLFGDVVTLEHRVCDLLREQTDRANGVVVARDDVVDVLRVAVRVDDGHHRDVELLRLFDRDVLLLRVDDEERVRQAVHLANADQVLLKLFTLAIESGALLLRHLLLGVAENGLDFLETLDRFADGREIRERAAEPAVVHVEHAAAIGLFENRVLRLAFGADEEDALPARGEIRNECGSFLKELQRLLQVNDVDPVALAEDVLLHLRVPALGLMTEVDASLQKLFHRNRDCQVTSCNPKLRIENEKDRGLRPLSLGCNAI